MKKVIMIAIVAAFVGYNVYTSQETNVLSDLALSNVEALADSNESGGGCENCAQYAIGICIDWGWGGCTGQPIFIYT